jgi:hypothetical protein
MEIDMQRIKTMLHKAINSLLLHAVGWERVLQASHSVENVTRFKDDALALHAT